MTRLRLSSHRLPVELGRYYKTPLQQRTCHFCQAGVGDEFHYLLDCESLEFKRLRETFIEKLIDVNQSFAMFAKTDLFHYLLGMYDDSVILITASYCKDILSLYDEQTEIMEQCNP